MKSKTSYQFGMLIMISLILLGTSAHGQQQQTSTETSMSLKIGIKGGLNLSNLHHSDVKENIKSGLNMGFFAKIPIVQGLSVQPEFIYSSKGVKYTYDNVLLGSGKYRFNLNYIESPLLMVVNLTRNFTISGGGYLAYLVSANVKSLRSDGTISNAQDLKGSDFNRIDYGLVGGLSVDLENATFGARYNYGLKEVGKSGSLSGDLTKNSKNSVFALFIGFAF